MQAVYDIDVEWWNDFEVQLGQLDINKFIKKFTPPEKSIGEIMEEVERRRKFEDKYGSDMLPSIDSHCARRLKGMLDVLQYCFEKWIDECHRTIIDPQYLHIEKEDSLGIIYVSPIVPAQLTMMSLGITSNPFNSLNFLSEMK